MCACVCLCVLTLITVAEVWARDTLLVALTVLLLAVRLSAIASLEVTLFRHCLLRSSKEIASSAGHVYTTVAGLHIRYHLVTDIWDIILLDDLCLSECLWVAHQNVLFGIDSNFIEFTLVVATYTCASCSTITIVGEAFTVEFQTLRLTAIAWLVSCRLSLHVACHGWVMAGIHLMLMRLLRVLWVMRVSLIDLLMLSVLRVESSLPTRN